MMRPTVKTLEFQKSNMAAAAILKKSKNRHISATVSALKMKFGRETHTTGVVLRVKFPPG